MLARFASGRRHSAALAPALLALGLAAGAATPASADDVTDAIDNALAAYADGDIQETLEELAFATQLLNEMKASSLGAYLPPALPGWTKEDSADFGAGMAMFGGGTGAEATYSGPSGRFSITIISDSPMIVAMAAAFANPGMIGGTLTRVGRERFVEQDGELSGLIDNRILVQASGGELSDMIAHLEQMDFRELEDF